MALPLVARRKFPFAAAAAFWLIALGVSFVDGRLVPFLFTIFVVGMAASFLLGSLRDARDAWMGLVIVLGGAAIVLYNLPTHSIGQLVFYPLLFGVCWLAGFALHERAEQADAAEARATQAEREREVAARIAVAEERARIARELHDVVAHSVSVMVLQVGAVQHKLPAALEEDWDALRHVEQTGRSALAEMRRLLGAMRARATAPTSRRSRASTASTRWLSRSRGPVCPCCSTWTEIASRCRVPSTSPRTGSCKRG